MNRGHQGFSLVEILVAMVISLLGILIIFQVFEVSEAIKRTTTSGGDAQQNGLLAMIAHRLWRRHRGDHDIDPRGRGHIAKLGLPVLLAARCLLRGELPQPARRDQDDVTLSRVCPQSHRRR